MAKAAYRTNPAKGVTTPHCLQTTMQKMAQIEKRVQFVVQCAEGCAVIFAEKIAEIDDAESYADICAVVRADACAEKWQRCRNGLQK